MIKNIFYLLFVSASFLSQAQQSPEIKKAANIIDQWHKAAANAQFERYFNLMTSDAIFIGTDATENWQLAEFKTFAKPYFERGKAWSFTSIERHLYQKNDVIYFDELLDTQMCVCRGSGIMYQEDGIWKIAHYVLSIAVPNDNVAELTDIKKDWDAKFINSKRG